VTGIVLTKLDGTAKGGIAVAIAQELNLPVRFVGVGEKMSDLLEFDRRRLWIRCWGAIAGSLASFLLPLMKFGLYYIQRLR
jgi:signal recognition particle GTPase